MNTYKNYIDLLRNILKNFDNNEFDSMINKILSKIFDEYYMDRNNKIYCIDNLYKKYYIGRYNRIKKKYGVVRNCNLIFRFNIYSKKSYIIRLLKDDFHVILDEGEAYKSIADDILEYNNIKNYKRYIRNRYLEKFLSRLDCKEDCKEVDGKEDDCKYNDDFEIEILKKICFYPPCLNTVTGDNYCSIHNKDII